MVLWDYLDVDFNVYCFMLEILAAVSSDQDPMVSGSETSSLNSLSFPSDMLRSAMSALGNGMDPDLSVFERFVYTEDFGSKNFYLFLPIVASICI